MRLDVFEYIEKASLYVEEKNKIIKSASKYLRTYFLDILKDNEEFINVRYRIKTKESINEKLLRQNYFLRSRDPKDVIKIMPDIIGIRVECRFNEDEKIIYEAIQNKFVLSDDAVWYYADEKKNVLLNLREMQPQLQKNGFEIYKVDGRYTYEGESFNFELQIKPWLISFGETSITAYSIKTSII